MLDQKLGGGYLANFIFFYFPIFFRMVASYLLNITFMFDGCCHNTCQIWAWFEEYNL